MEIRFKIKSMVLKSTTKREPKFTYPLIWSYGTHGKGLRMIGKDVFIAVNYEKHRKKVIQKKGKDGKTKSKVVERAHWIIRYYEIPFEILQFTGMKLHQGSRSFKLVKA